MLDLFSRMKIFFSKKITGRKKMLYIFGFVFLFGLIGNAYGFLDFNFSHDSSIMVQSDGLWQVMIGRYLQPFYVSMRGQLFSPFIVGILSLIYISVSVYLITDVFKIKSIGGITLTSGILSTNSVFCLTSATYIYLIDIFMFSLMCSCIGTYFCSKYTNRHILSIMFFVISLALYQSYWQVAILILMFTLIQDILKNVEFKTILKKVIRYFLILFSSILIYYVLIDVFQNIYGVSSVNSYNSVPSFSTYLNISNDIKLIKGAYKEFVRYYIYPSIHGAKVVATLTFICFLTNGITALIISIKNKINWKNFIFLILIALLLPLGANIVYVITGGMIHGLMIYSFFIPYVFCIALYENNSIKLNVNTNLLYYLINVLALVVLIFNSIIYSNQVYMKKHVEFSYTYATLNRIIFRIEEIENYDLVTSKVMFVGGLENSKLSVKKEYFDYSDVGLSGTFAVTYLDTYRTFINNIMGYPMNVITDEDLVKEVSKIQEVKNLVAFPSKNCIAVIDDMIVVKLSELE